MSQISVHRRAHCDLAGPIRGLAGSAAARYGRHHPYQRRTVAFLTVLPPLNRTGQRQVGLPWFGAIRKVFGLAGWTGTQPAVSGVTGINPHALSRSRVVAYTPGGAIRGITARQFARATKSAPRCSCCWSSLTTRPPRRRSERLAARR